ncbi:hypothetical protein EVAR_74349_1 [Eumeta japonica]|uniref:Uncharacterized protein n=1 Tax=Eumeta variegata TaxID=151549 RepID=A0A4C1SD59_EUMVA|nr:hypothetical protein EVAR_74349_1 [Eumeta japonica]
MRGYALEWNIIPCFGGGIYKTAPKCDGSMNRSDKTYRTTGRGPHFHIQTLPNIKSDSTAASAVHVGGGWGHFGEYSGPVTMTENNCIHQQRWSVAGTLAHAGRAIQFSLAASTVSLDIPDIMQS